MSNTHQVGNLTMAPELRFTPSGLQVVNFSIAVNRRWQNKQTQEWEEAVSFFDVVCFGDMAEHVAETCVGGMRVVVLGRLDQSRWETPEGDKRSRVKINADEVAPSLKWATAAVTKVPKKGGSGDPEEAGYTRTRPQGSSHETHQDAAHATRSLDEEPF